MDEVRLSVTGMSCASCVAKIENHLMELPGVESASVALTTNEARISFNGDKTGVRTILAVVNDLGYHAEVQQEGNDVERMQQQQAKAVNVGCGTNLHKGGSSHPLFPHACFQLRVWWIRLVWAAIFTIPTIVIHMFLMHIPALKPFFMMVSPAPHAAPFADTHY